MALQWVLTEDDVALNMAHASRIKIFRSGDTFRPSALMPNGAAGEWVTMATFTDELSAERFVTSIIEKGN